VKPTSSGENGSARSECADQSVRLVRADPGSLPSSIKLGIALEATAALAFAAAAIRLLPFSRVAKLASSGRSRGREAKLLQKAEIDKVCWSVRGAAWRVPWRTVCFQKGLATHLMLRRRGIASVLHYGISHPQEDALAAHVWISVGDEIVMGGNEAKGFRCVVEFPRTD
jgi:hypothetical protein